MDGQPVDLQRLTPAQQHQVSTLVQSATRGRKPSFLRPYCWGNQPNVLAPAPISTEADKQLFWQLYPQFAGRSRFNWQAMAAQWNSIVTMQWLETGQLAPMRIKVAAQLEAYGGAVMRAAAANNACLCMLASRLPSLWSGGMEPHRQATAPCKVQVQCSLVLQAQDACHQQPVLAVRQPFAMPVAMSPDLAFQWATRLRHFSGPSAR